MLTCVINDALRTCSNFPWDFRTGRLVCAAGRIYWHATACQHIKHFYNRGWPVTLSALASRLRRERPNAPDAEIRAELVEMITRGLADGDPAYLDLLHNLIVEKLLEDGE